MTMRHRSIRSTGRRRRSQRGFALFAIIILLALMTTAVALSLDQAVSNIQSAGSVRASEMIKAGLEHGLDQAIAQLQTMSVSDTANPPPQWDIFAGPSVDGSAPTEFMPSVPYPSTGPYTGQYRVRFGLRAGQRTRAPAGEDINEAYGQIVEVQVGIEAIGAGIPPAEERVSIGVVIPRKTSHTN